MSDRPKIDQQTYDRLETVGILITTRNELVEARASAHTATFAYANPRGDGVVTIKLEYQDRQRVVECFIQVLDDKLRKIDDQLRDQGLGSLIGE